MDIVSLLVLYATLFTVLPIVSCIRPHSTVPLPVVSSQLKKVAGKVGLVRPKGVG